MLPAAVHLLLSGLQVVDNRSLVVELCIDGQRLDEHAYGVVHSFVAAAIIDCGEQRLLLVVEFGQQEGVCRREQGALEDAMLLAERLHTVAADGERACQAAFTDGCLLAVGNQRSVHVAAVERLCIPLPGLLEGGRLSLRLFLQGHIGQRDVLFVGSDALISLVDVGEHLLHRRAIDDDMMIVDEQIQVAAVPQQPYVEQPSASQLEGFYQLLPHGGKVADVFHTQRPRLIADVDGLHRLAVVVQLQPGEEGGVGCHSLFDGPAQTVGVELTV